MLFSKKKLCLGEKSHLNLEPEIQHENRRGCCLWKRCFSCLSLLSPPRKLIKGSRGVHIADQEEEEDEARGVILIEAHRRVAREIKYRRIKNSPIFAYLFILENEDG